MSHGLVLDTSALVAPLLREPGGDLVLEAAASSDPLLPSAVNLAEAVDILHRRRGLLPKEARDDVFSLGVEVIAFDAEQSELVGSLEPVLRNRGVSFGDRACLMLGRLRPCLCSPRTGPGRRSTSAWRSG